MRYPRYWFQFNWSAACALCVLKLRYNQNCPFKATFPIFENRACFSVTSIALNDVNVRGGNVINPFARDIGSDQKFYRYSRFIGKGVGKLWICDQCMLNDCFRKYSMPFYFCLTESLQLGGKYMQCILVCFLKSL